MLDEHNKARSEVVPKASNMKYMTWDATLAGEAVALARVCVNQHSNVSLSLIGCFRSAGMVNLLHSKSYFYHTQVHMYHTTNLHLILVKYKR